MPAIQPIPRFFFYSAIPESYFECSSAKCMGYETSMHSIGNKKILEITQGVF
jgi:hypothetical protein